MRRRNYLVIILLLLPIISVTEVSGAVNYTINGNVTATSTAKEGGTISISAVLAHTGDTTTTNVNFAFYRSVDATITTADTLIFTDYRTMDPAWTYSVSTTYNIPYGVTGSFYFGVIVDYDNAVTESDENDNWKASTTPSTITASADLQAVSVSGTASAQAGASVSINGQISNLGSIGTGSSFNVAYYLSTDTSLSTSADIYLGFQTIGPLAAYQTYTLPTKSATIPATTPIGLYYYILYADSSNAIVESSASNVVASTSLLSVASPNDFRADTVSTGTTTMNAGNILSISIAISNTGTTTSPISTYEIYISTDTNLNAFDTSIGSFQLPGITVGGQHTDTLSITIPVNTPTGSYYLVIKADPLNTIVESNEGNNIKFSSSTITVSGNKDMSVTSISLPGDQVRASTGSISVEIANNGGDASGSFQAKLYLSLDTTLSTGTDILFSTITISSFTISTTISFLGTYPDNLNTYYVIVELDTLNQVSESVETNNIGVSITTITLRDLINDLSINTITINNVANNSYATYTANINNNDNSISFVISFYASSDTVFNVENDYWFANYTVTSFSSVITASVSRLIILPLGHYYVIVILDIENSVSESDETNNIGVSTNTFEVFLSDNNDNMASAQLITPGFLNGTVSNGDNADYYTFACYSGNYVALEILSYYQVEVRVILPSNSITLTTTQLSTLYVSPLISANGDCYIVFTFTGSTEIGTYTGGFSRMASSDGNDSSTYAPAVPVDGRIGGDLHYFTRSGSNNWDDFDHYSINFVAGMSYYFNLRTTSLDIYLRVWYNGNQVGGGMPMIFNADITGQYILEFRSIGGSGIYYGEVTELAMDTLADATNIIDNTISGTLDRNNYRDYYIINLNSYETISIEGNHTATSNQYIKVKLLDATGILLIDAEYPAYQEFSLSYIVLQTGSYYILITNTYNEAYSYEGSVTTTPGTQPSLTITSPNSSGPYYFGTTLTITWSSTGSIPITNIKLELYLNGVFNQVISSSISNSHGSNSYTWIIPTLAQESDSYQIYIASTSDRTINDLSVDISIGSDAQNPPPSSTPTDNTNTDDIEDDGTSVPFIFFIPAIVFFVVIRILRLKQDEFK